MGDGASGYSLMVIIGPILLAAVLAWAYLRNRKDKRGLRDTEAATRDLYQAQDAQDKATESKVQR